MNVKACCILYMWTGCMADNNSVLLSRSAGVSDNETRATAQKVNIISPDALQ